jgi:hypothetical protein
MTEYGEREKDLGSGMLEDARSAITKRNKALRDAMDEPHEPGTKRQNARVDERDE